ncbi:MAG: hypothetical protein HAW67_06640, partial [Endozoicomonadaceae bacterium]|nr:hypothetical protein [Endozoicomonadaceae bacterium]
KPDKLSYEDEQKRKELKIVYETLLPWLALRTKVIIGLIEKQQVAEKIEALPKELENHYGRHAYELNQLHNEITITWLSILIKSKNIDKTSTNNLLQWLNSNRHYTGIDTWTKLAKTIAHSQNSTESALIFASHAANIIESEKVAASDAANSYAELSKAVLVSDKEEARAYLSLSFEILNRLDHDNWQRLQLLFSLAQQSGQRQQAEPKEAYRLARVAELAHAYNDHKFPWPDVAVAIAELCPVSSIAIFSRWWDRDLIWYGEMLPAITKHLLEKRLLSPSVLVALNAFSEHWRYAEVIETIFEQESNSEKRQQIIEILERDIELSGCEDHSAQGIMKAFQNSGNLSKKIKTKLIPLQEKYNQKHTQTYEHSVSLKEDNVDEIKKIDNQSFISTEEIDHIVLSYKKEKNHYSWETFFQHLRNCVAPAQRVTHLYALIDSYELDTSLILDALKQAFEQWGMFAAIKKAMPKVAMDLLQKNGAAFLTFWELSSNIDDFSSLTQQPKPDILEIFLQTAIHHIDDISAQSLQALIIQYSKLLSPDDCFDVLVFALDQFEPLLAENDGEGEWHEDKKPECSIPEAIAGMLWAFLAAPESKIRWEAAHAIRRLCKLGQIEEIEALINLFNETRLQHFTDTNLPFYAMHAQLYALIAFNRAAYEAPDTLLPFSRFFAECALQQEFPHVQIKHFAAQTALALEQYKTNTYDSETLHALKNINSSHYPRVTEKADYSHRMDYYDIEDSSYYFNHDLCEGWFHSLANVFSKISQKNVVQQSEHWIKNIWRVNHTGSWSDDPRQDRWNRARHNETYISKYSYPQVDTYNFYLSIHAMFCVAGELLQKKPIRIGEWKDDEWGDWLRAHFLTRKDGLWLADIRDAKPKIYHSEQDENHDSKWCWSITNSLFDELLFPITEENNQIIVKGNIYQSTGYEQTESISINSALVKPDHAQSLLHALQTCEDPFRFGIPDAYNDLEIKTAPYKLKGWIYQPEKEKELDRLDSLSGDIPYPPVLVRASVARIMGLQKSTDDKFWSCDNESI